MGGLFRKTIFFSVLTLFMLVGCSSPVNTEIADEIVERLNNEDSITQYVTDEFTFSQNDPREELGSEFIDFDLKASTNSNFANLSEEEKNNVLLTVKDLISDRLNVSFIFHCSEDTICSFRNIEFSDETDTYSLEGINSLDSSFNHNGEKVNFPEKDSENGTEINREAIYQFMKQKYDEITNYGENYIPETHDPMVAKMASEQFGISESEAGNIFIEEDKKALGM